MAAGGSLICPACGARNKPKWEFCARCGESLQGVTLAKATAPDVDLGEGAEGPPASAAWSFILPVAAVAVLTVLGVAGWRYARKTEPPPSPDPSLFAFTARPEPAPSGDPALAQEPGVKDLAEGQRLLATGDVAAAIPFLERAVAAAPSNVRFVQILAGALWSSGARDRALQQHAAAARLDPAQGALPYARALEAAGRPADAAKEYEQLLSLQPGNLAVKESLANALSQAGDFAKAAPLLEAVAAQRPDDQSLQQSLAYALEKSGQGGRAAQVYGAVLERVPDAQIARARMADLLFGQGRSEDAVALLRAGLGRDPSVPAFRRQLGSILERSGRKSEAVQEYREYVRLAPNAPDAKAISEQLARLERTGGS